jgi:4a-hydroxytetrahydrobiopterin dehydratase
MVPVFDRMSPERILLTPNQVTAAVAELEGWVVDDGHLKKTFVCRNFSEAIAFIVAFSYACERIDHHPEIRNIYHRVAISITSYDAGAKISTHDIELAKQIDAVAGSFVMAAK